MTAMGVRQRTPSLQPREHAARERTAEEVGSLQTIKEKGSRKMPSVRTEDEDYRLLGKARGGAKRGRTACWRSDFAPLQAFRKKKGKRWGLKN